MLSLMDERQLTHSLALCAGATAPGFPGGKGEAPWDLTTCQWQVTPQFQMTRRQVVE